MNKNNEYKLVPRLRFPEFENAGEWEVKKVGDILVESRMPSKINDPEKRITVRLNMKGVEKREYRGTESENATYFFVRKKGQFIYGKQNFHKGAFGIIPDELNGYESSQDLPAFDFRNGFSSKFFFYFLSQETVYPKLEEIATGTGSKRIHPKDFFHLLIPFLSLPEQQKIASCLSSLDEVITAESQKLELLKEHKKGLLQNLFPQEGETVPKLRFPEFVQSASWNNIKIGDIAQVSTGGTPESTNPEYWGGEIPWMNSGELNHKRIYSVSNYITKKGYHESSTKLIPPNCVLIGLAGQGKTRGTVAINYIELCTNQSIGAIHPNGEVFESEFLFQMLDSLYEKLRKLSAGDGGRGGLNLQIIKAIEIFLPSLKEQQKIASCLSSLDDLINAQRQKIELLKQHKKGLLQGLFPPINN